MSRRNKRKYKRGSSDKTVRRLLKKKSATIEWLAEHNVRIAPNANEYDVIRCAYQALGMQAHIGHLTVIGAHQHYSTIMSTAGIKDRLRLYAHPLVEAEVVGLHRNPPTAEQKKARRSRQGDIEEFYQSFEWRRLRYHVLKRDGGRCLVCGQSAADGIVLHVDHIKPLRYNWDLRLDPDNLQVLCSVCNHGKGNWDETDWHHPPPAGAVETSVPTRPRIDAVAERRRQRMLAVEKHSKEVRLVVPGRACLPEDVQSKGESTWMD